MHFKVAVESGVAEIAAPRFGHLGRVIDVDVDGDVVEQRNAAIKAEVAIEAKGEVGCEDGTISVDKSCWELVVAKALKPWRAVMAPRGISIDAVLPVDLAPGNA